MVVAGANVHDTKLLALTLESIVGSVLVVVMKGLNICVSTKVTTIQRAQRATRWWRRKGTGDRPGA